MINHSCASNGKFCENFVNIIPADALAPYVARSSPGMILTMQGTEVLVIIEGG